MCIFNRWALQGPLDFNRYSLQRKSKFGAFFLNFTIQWRWCFCNQNSTKWPKMTQNGPKWPKMTQNGPKWPKMTQNDPNRPKMAHNGPKWPNMTQNDPKWPKMALFPSLLKSYLLQNWGELVICVGHTAWVPEGRERRSQAGPKGQKSGRRPPARNRGPAGP